MVFLVKDDDNLDLQKEARAILREAEGNSECITGGPAAAPEEAPEEPAEEQPEETPEEAEPEEENPLEPGAPRWRPDFADRAGFALAPRCGRLAG